jgi:hypothetical protein
MLAVPRFKKILAFASLASLFSMAFAAGPEAPHLGAELKLNQIQVLGTHNSYSIGMDPRLAAIFASRVAPMFKGFIDQLQGPARAKFMEEHPNGMDASEMLNYRHPSLTEQLELGVRSLEIDINPDPVGGIFSDPMGYRILREQGITGVLPFDSTDLEKPGFKVLHIRDIDFRSSCPTLRACLSEIRSWSEKNPKHIPIFIMIEAKYQGLALFPNPVKAVPFSRALFDEMDREILETLGRERVITPDNVRGNYPTLNAAVRAGNWPHLDAARGKIVFMMLTTDDESGAAAYLDGHPGLRGRASFLFSKPDEEHAAFLLLDNSLVRGGDIKRRVGEGYMVRTRADIETYEAKINDLSRAKSAFESGAQIVSTDFESPGNAYGTSYVVNLPGGGAARCNVISSQHCPVGPVGGK